jgi:hypothetical protein
MQTKWKLEIEETGVFLKTDKNKFYYEIIPLTFGRARIIYTDGSLVDNGW